jgi:hypothetical protein
LDQAVRLIAVTMDVEYCAFLVPTDRSGAMLLRAGMGWRADRADRCENPPLVSWPRLLREHDISSGLSVVMSSDVRAVLGVYSNRERLFSAEEVTFLRQVGDLLTAPRLADALVQVA